MTLRLDIRKLARDDVRRNADWLRTTFSLAKSTRWVAGVVVAFDSLRQRPEQYPEADEAADLSLPLRYKLFGRRPHVFRILFTIEGNTINVLRVLHASQDRMTEDEV